MIKKLRKLGQAYNVFVYMQIGALSCFVIVENLQEMNFKYLVEYTNVYVKFI